MKINLPNIRKLTKEEYKLDLLELSIEWKQGVNPPRPHNSKNKKS